MPHVQHGSGRPLIIDEAYALSHTRIVQGAIPGCRSNIPGKETVNNGPQAQERQEERS